MLEPIHLSVAILCGGLGTRLREVVPDRQKALAEVSGRPFITRLIDQLYDSGCRQFILLGGHLAEQLQELSSTSWPEATVQLSVEETPLGTGGAIKNALHLYRSNSVLVLNGDSYCELDLGAFLRFHQAKGARLSLAAQKVADTRRYGALQFAADFRMTRFKEKDEALSLPAEGHINAGVYLVELSMIESIPSDRPVSLERECLPNWLNWPCFAFPTSGLFIDIGIPEDYQRAQLLFSEIGLARDASSSTT